MMKDQYSERWCRLTKASFKVYMGSQAFAHLDTSGLLEVPIARISHIQRVKYDIRAKSLALRPTQDN